MVYCRDPYRHSYARPLHDRAARDDSDDRDRLGRLRVRRPDDLGSPFLADAHVVRPGRGVGNDSVIQLSVGAARRRRTPGLTLKPVAGQVVDWVNFTDQWDTKSPWRDRRVRLAAAYAIDRQAMNQAERLGFAKITWSLVPRASSSIGSRPGTRTIPSRPSSFSPTRAIPTASTRETIPVMPRSPTWGNRSSTISTRLAFA